VHNCDDKPFTFTTGLRTHFATKDIPRNNKTVRTLGLFGAPRAACIRPTAAAASCCAPAARQPLADAGRSRPLGSPRAATAAADAVPSPPCFARCAGKYVMDYTRNPLDPALWVENSHYVTFGDMKPRSLVYADCQPQGDVLFCPGTPVRSSPAQLQRVCTCLCVYMRVPVCGCVRWGTRGPSAALCLRRRLRGRRPLLHRLAGSKLRSQQRAGCPRASPPSCLLVLRLSLLPLRSTRMAGRPCPQTPHLSPSRPPSCSPTSKSTTPAASGTSRWCTPRGRRGARHARLWSSARRGRCARSRCRWAQTHHSQRRMALARRACWRRRGGGEWAVKPLRAQEQFAGRRRQGMSSGGAFVPPQPSGGTRQVSAACGACSAAAAPVASMPSSFFIAPPSRPPGPGRSPARLGWARCG
jgi:hypothetical protein